MTRLNINRAEALLFFRLLIIPQVGALSIRNYDQYFVTYMSAMMVLYETKMQPGAKRSSGCGYSSTLTVLVTGSYAEQRRENELKKKEREDSNASGNTGRGE